jgi:hypothetical protein
MPFKDKDKNRKYQKDWAKRNRASQKRYIDKLKIKVINKLGGKCIYCGCDNPNAFEMNHINGGGYDEYKAHGGCQKQILLDILAGRRTDIELTCRVCNALHYLVKIKGLKNRWKIIYE